MKFLTLSKKLTDGRNNSGKITVDHRGGGNSFRYRVIDFKRTFKFMKGRVLKFIPDATRTANLALIFFDNGFMAYYLAVESLSVGDVITISQDAEVIPGNSLILKNIPFGFSINSVDLLSSPSDKQIGANNKFLGAKVARAAGNAAQILKKTGSYTLLKLNSGELRWFPSNSYATVGVVSPQKHHFVKNNKAGNSRWKGRKPVVRGTAKNPVDHPHGGGQGKTSGGRCSVTPWAKLTKGKRTRKKKKNSNFIYRFRFFKL